MFEHIAVHFAMSISVMSAPAHIVAAIEQALSD
jgi:hypothetical protein